MKNLVRTTTAALLALTLVALAPAASEAGMNSGTYPVACQKYADSSGACWVSLAGFRANPDPNAWVMIIGQGSNGTYWPNGSFLANLNGNYYSCSVNRLDTSPIRDVWAQLTNRT